jgi:acetyltransferase-like isoleucine patch superfamily enzyme
MIKKIKEIKWLIYYLPKLYKKYKGKTDANLFFVLKNFIFFKLFYDKHIIAHRKVKINGIENIELKGSLEIGVSPFGTLLNTDPTFINVRGKLKINSSHYSIGRGCRIDIGEHAIVEIGEKGHITGFTNMIISHKLTIGDDCAISWNCQFLDDDHQEIFYPDKQQKKNGIIIGNHVWIGCGAQIYKGTVIPNGCVIASNSVVKAEFTSQNSLIGGVPARIIKSNVEWD